MGLQSCVRTICETHFVSLRSAHLLCNIMENVCQDDSFFQEGFLQLLGIVKCFVA